jgi:hypothetical protein
MLQKRPLYFNQATGCCPEHTHRPLPEHLQLLDTSEEIARIKLSLSLSLIERNQISKPKQSRLIAELQLAGKCTQPHLYQELLLSRSQGPNSRTSVTAVDYLMQLL